ncbi:MAG: hypothetical protein HFF42_09635 [Lawsonibacter sp.]|jgi:hypothetical protein|nr:hypothetical protein [Lawsonibacter sp.]
MEIGDYHAILDLLIIFYGLSGLTACLKMHRTHRLSSSRLIVPNGMAPEECADPEAYLRCILPRAAIFSLVNLTCGGVNLICVFLPDVFPSLLLNITIPTFLSNLLIFGVSLRRAVKRFWPG